MRAFASLFVVMGEGTLANNAMMETPTIMTVVMKPAERKMDGSVVEAHPSKKVLVNHLLGNRLC